MKHLKLLLMITVLVIFASCDKNKSTSSLTELGQTNYYKSEIFSEDYSEIYGKWELSSTSGGISGAGCGLSFDYLEIRQYGIYGFIKDDALVEFGKITIDLSDTSGMGLKINFEKDENSGEILYDKEKHVILDANTLNLYSPCCDRYNYHFLRVE